MKSVTTISQTVEKWFHPENESLQKAVEKTIAEDIFSAEDVRHQLSVLRENVASGEIEEWAERSGLNEQHHAKGKKVLCLHAGNLPLVGFQTALGTILSGADYYGKLSRKDPYLLASFLEEVKNSGLDRDITYSTELSDFKNLQADKIVFAGSEESVPEVKAEIIKLKAAKPDAGYLIRTAKFSIAYLDEWNEEIKENLTEAMLRYGGKGCRSVAVVVAEFKLDEVKEELEQAIQSYWKKNPPHQKPTPDLTYQFAYNKAIERNQLWLEDFLIQETKELPETDFTVNWVKGGAAKVRELKAQFGTKVQSVYSAGTEISGLETEELAKAQRPPLWWKPDGVDVVKRFVI